jgi:hypothetical protein
MRRLIKISAVFSLGLLAFSCNDDNDSDDISLEKQLMVEAYVYANEPVNHIKIARVHENGGSDPIPVNDANVKISQGSVTADLVLLDDEEGVYGIADSQMVFSGEEPLFLEIIYQGKTCKASTEFPPAIENLNISDNHVNLSESLIDQFPLTTLSWNDPNGEHTYCIFSKATDSDTTIIYPIQSASDSPLYGLHNETSVDLYSEDFTHIGNYLLYVSIVNEEYIQMYSAGSTPDLRGAPSNVDGAWGVFTAFNGLSVEITVE